MSDDRPTLVISDLHLGRPDMVAKAAELAPIVDQASTLVVNGDVAEIAASEWAEAARRELEHLRERCRVAGTRLRLLAGNHDPDLTPERHLLLSSGRVLVTHGDAIDESLAPWSDLAATIRARHRAVLAAMPVEERTSLEGIFHAAREAAKAEFEVHDAPAPPTSLLGAARKPWKVIEITRFWRSHPRRMAAFAARHAPAARVVIVGHSHRAGVRRRGPRTIVNTGCFGVPGPALAVRIDASGLGVHEIDRSGHGSTRLWRMRSRPGHRDASIAEPDPATGFEAA